MSKAKKKITTEVLTVRDEKFNVDQLDKYILSLSFSTNSIKCSVLEPKKKRILWFDHITWEDESMVLQAMDEIYDNHSFLAAGFWKRVLVAENNPFFTLVPSTFFEKSKEAEVLRTTFGDFDPALDSRSHKHAELGFHSVFLSNKSVLDYLKKKYPKKQIVHTHSADGLLQLASGTTSSNQAPELWLDWSGSNLKASLLRKGSLEFFNSFECNYPEDVFFFSSTLASQLELEDKEIDVHLSGDFNEENQLMDNLKSYFPKAKLADRPKLFYFGFPFDEVPEFKHLDSFSSFFAL